MKDFGAFVMLSEITIVRAKKVCWKRLANQAKVATVLNSKNIHIFTATRANHGNKMSLTD